MLGAIDGFKLGFVIDGVELGYFNGQQTIVC